MKWIDDKFDLERSSLPTVKWRTDSDGDEETVKVVSCQHA